jgi:hypothetical protein
LVWRPPEGPGPVALYPCVTGATASGGPFHEATGAALGTLLVVEAFCESAQGADVKTGEPPASVAFGHHCNISAKQGWTPEGRDAEELRTFQDTGGTFRAGDVRLDGFEVNKVEVGDGRRHNSGVLAGWLPPLPSQGGSTESITHGKGLGMGVSSRLGGLSGGLASFLRANICPAMLQASGLLSGSAVRHCRMIPINSLEYTGLLGTVYLALRICSLCSSKGRQKKHK